MAVVVTACDEPVDVSLTVAPTAEFWIDNEGRLDWGVVVRVAIPTPAGTSEEDAVVDARGWTVDDGLAPYASGVTAKKVLTFDVEAEAARASTFLTLTVPEWGTDAQPRGGRLQGRLDDPPLLPGQLLRHAPLVDGTAHGARHRTSARKGGGRRRGRRPARPRELLRPHLADHPGCGNYRPQYEVTRGVTSLDLKGHTIDAGATLPGPDANLGGTPAWTCRSNVPKDLKTIYSTDAGDPAADVYSTLTALGTVALSDARLAGLLDQRTCASYVAIDSSAAGIRRDLLLMGVGVLFAAGST